QEYLVEELKRLGEYENTIIVLSGDNGIPGFPHGKANLYDFGVRAPLIIRWGDIKYTGRKLDDFVNLIDLAPTFLEAAGIEIPETMDGKSLIPLLMSKKEGLIHKKRDHVVVGRERHGYRKGGLPYPSRAIHTKDFIYILNFKPDRVPIGVDENTFEPELVPPGFRKEFSLESQLSYEFNEDYANQRSALILRGIDNGPTKAWFVTNMNTPEYKKYYEMGFGKRPKEELYDLRLDPDQLNNVAGDKKYLKI
ncbi:MAG: sulfatase-like hydrolase/transferase, partial [Bacteroidetes bacterium]|nr:sulfatase-like hydrolase/transferase [Bacteroidota bacterium]